MSDPNLQKILVNKLLDERFDQVEALFAKGLVNLREALRAERTILGRDGEPVYLGPDHGARLAAVKSLIELCLGNRRPSEKQPEEPKRTVTMDELRGLLGAIRDLPPDDQLKYDQAQEMKRSMR
jgi:hypothetical protein